MVPIAGFREKIETVVRDLGTSVVTTLDLFDAFRQAYPDDIPAPGVTDPAAVESASPETQFASALQQYAATGAGVISATCVQIQAPADRWEGGWVRVYLVRMAARGHPQETEPPLVESSLSLAGIAMAIAALFPELSLPLVVLAPLVAWSSVVAGLSSYAALRALGRSYRVLVQARQGQGATCGHRFCKHDTVLLLQHGRATSHWWVAVSILFFFSMVLLVDVMFIVSNYLDWAIEKGL